MKKTWIVFALILLVGMMVRLVGLDSVPVGLNADEAYAGYEAWSIGETGADSHGYTNPVYFVSWGSGMNVLYSYLSVPAVKIFGLSVFSLRVTQAVLGCATLVIIFLIVRKLLGEKKALIAMGLLAICPWHVMLSRWGLESDILPFCLSLGMLGVVYGLEKKPWLVLAAVGFGLSMYSYAVAWAIIPFLVVGIVWHGVRTGKIGWDKWSIISGGVLVAICLPLALFLAVNAGILPEIRTPLLSIPKMPAFGSGGYDVNVVKHLGELIGVIFSVKPDDYNVIAGYGLFFLPSLPLMMYGLWLVGKGFVADARKRKWSLNSVLGLWIAACVPVMLFITDVNATRINAVLMPLFLCVVVGLLEITREGAMRRLMPVALSGYAVMFCFFCYDYLENKAWNFPEVVEAIEYTNDVEGEVYFDGQNFAQVLVAARPMMTPEEAIIENDEGTEWKSGRIDVQRMGRYHLQTGVDEEIDEGGIYVIHATNKEFEEKLTGNGFSVVEQTADRKVLRRE